MQISRRTLIGTTFIAALGLTRAGAQDEQEDAGQLLQMVPGITSAYARKYLPEGSVPSATPAAAITAATPDYLLAMMITFESETTAQGVIAQMLNTEIAGMIMQRSAAGLELTSNTDLPVGNRLFFGEFTDEAHPYASLLMIPLGELVVLMNATGESADIQPTVDAIAAYIAEQERGSVPVTVVHRGLATGDVFDMLPDMDQRDLLGGLRPSYDYDLLVSEMPIEPADGATPEGTPHDHGH